MTNILILTIDLTAVKCTTYDYHISFLETFKQFYVYPSGLVSIHSFIHSFIHDLFGKAG